MRFAQRIFRFFIVYLKVPPVLFSFFSPYLSLSLPLNDREKIAVNNRNKVRNKPAERTGTKNDGSSGSPALIRTADIWQLSGALRPAHD